MIKRWVFLIFLLAGLGIAAYFHWHRTAPTHLSPSPPAPIAVLIQPAQARDVPIWLTGLGTAQAPNTVTIRPRVSGVLESVNFTEGAMVKAGDVLAQIDPRPYQSILNKAKAKLLQDLAQLKNAKVEVNRYQALKEKNAISQQQLDAATVAEAQIAALVQADQASVDAAQLDLDFTTIRAPMAGCTGIRQVDPGNLVTANQDQGLVVLTDMSGIAVIFTLSQQHLGTLRQALTHSNQALTVLAYSQQGDCLDQGKLELMDNQINPSTGSIRLKATFANEKRSLWPGLFVSVKLLVETRKNAVTVPTEAVNAGLNGPFCYVLKPDHSVEPRPVKLGPATEADTLIEQGLLANEPVVVVGQNKLKPGSKVAPQYQTP